MGKLQNYADQHPAGTYTTLTPPAYQAKHRHSDAAAVILGHHPDKKNCRCGILLAGDRDWADHLADVLFPLHRRSQV